MSIFFSYVLLGLSLAAPIGPVNAAQMDRGIKYGFFHSWFVGLGAMIADCIYMIVVYMGLVTFIDTPIVQIFLWLFGSFVLLYTGIESIVNASRINIKNSRNKESFYKAFFSGFMMSLTNPLTILFWLGIYGSLLAQTAATATKNELVFYSLAIILGLLVWDVTMAAISSSFRKISTSRLLVFISVVSGLSLLCFGVYFAYQGITLLAFSLQ
ncbi:MAG TPA: LysE family transporter [Bacillus bacterium]|nr:LysE family transporter [Bacillus sp. (in: firmicutes)]